MPACLPCLPPQPAGRASAPRPALPPVPRHPTPEQGRRECVDLVARSGLDVFAHNVETVERLQGVVRDRRAGWAQSLGVLAAAKQAGARVTKTSIMLGCGETPDEVVQTLKTLRRVWGGQHKARRSGRRRKGAGLPRQPPLAITPSCGLPAHAPGACWRCREYDVDVVTLGQYMRPTKRHMAVAEYVTPEAFEAYQKVGGLGGLGLCCGVGPGIRQGGLG